MLSRIEAHRKSRPAHWRTLEFRTDVAEALADHIDDAEVVIVDCITLMISNMMGKDDAEIKTWQERVIAEIEQLITVMKSSPAHFIIISNEVGLGLVPAYPLGRLFRDIMGIANQMLARSADEVNFMVAGIPMVLKKRDNPE